MKETRYPHKYPKFVTFEQKYIGINCFWAGIRKNKKSPSCDPLFYPLFQPLIFDMKETRYPHEDPKFVTFEQKDIRIDCFWAKIRKIKNDTYLVI